MPTTPIDGGHLLGDALAPYTANESGILSIGTATYTLTIVAGFWEVQAGTAGRRLSPDDYGKLRVGAPAAGHLFLADGRTWELADDDGWALAEPA